MVFSSIAFLFFFFPLFLITYYLAPHNRGYGLKNLVLLIFSLIFYAWGEPVYIVLMIFSSIVDYTNGRLITRYKDKQNLRRFFMICSVIVNLALLGLFKYADFLIINLNNLFGLSLDTLKLGLPIGISFFTFQTMSYSIDVYRGDVKCEKNFLTFMTYVCMFPQLIAGPIVRYQTVAEELHQRTISFNNFSSGLMRFTFGLFKKVLIANQVGKLWSLSAAYLPHELTLVGAWLGIIAFALQIYFDFSGYSDMAIGIGKMLGFNYLENFNYPYISKSITEFWRRWHMSLSSFFRDYVYIPLGGSRCSTIINIRNIAIVWALTGLWHGASWNFVLWGLYFGLILIIEKFIIKDFLAKRSNIFKHIYALVLIMIGWAIFASADITYTKDYLLALVGIDVEFISQNVIYLIINNASILIIAIILSTPIYQVLKRKYIAIDNNLIKKLIAVVFIVAVIILFIVMVAYLVSDTYNPFLYFRF